MNRNIALALGTVIGIFAMLLFLQSNVDLGSFQLRKLSKEIDNRLRVEFKTQKYLNDRPPVSENLVPDKCL